jgi:RNA polymerase sigma-70 factor (ECF subfamily)
VLRDYQDLAYAEIASTLKIPRGTVMSRLHRARRLLHDLVRDKQRSTGEVRNA